MRPLRAFLFSKSDGVDWVSSAFRELEPLLDEARAVMSIEGASAAIHVGFWRPETSKIADIAQAWPRALLLSDAAIGSLPPPVSVSSQPVGEVDGLQFYLALAGFGYEVADPTQSSVKPLQSAPIPVLCAQGVFEPRGWVKQMLEAQPQFEEVLRSAHIWDDECYIANENLLDTSNRLALSLARYTLIAGERPSASGIFNKLDACPPWFLSEKLKNLETTVRMANVFNGNNLVTVAHIAAKGYNGLLKLPNLGLGSVNGLGKLLLNAFINGDALKRTPSRLLNEVDPEMLVNDGPESEPSSVDGDIQDGLLKISRRDAASSLVDGIVEVAQCLNEHERGIFVARLGFRCESHTLQQISDKIGVSRERVRQIVVKIFKKIQRHLFWESLSERLDGLLAERASPLLLAGIPAIDPWFKGAEELENSLVEIFKHLFPERFSIVKIDDVPVITHLSNEEWIDAVDSGMTLLREMVNVKPTEEYFRLQIEALLSDKGAELRETLWRQVASFALWANCPDDTRRLSGFGGTVEALVTAVLEEADMPLHFTEIERRASHFDGRKFEARRLHQTAASVGMLYARGTYGLLSHCPLSNDERDLIISEVEDIVSNGDTNRQWHASELMDELLDRGLDFDGRLSKYIINIALQNSEILVYMKRMVWGLKGSWTESAASRLDLRQAVISLLESEGAPMSTSEIREKLFSGRGVNSNFQIHPAGNLIRIGTGRWGLSDRDIQISDPVAYFNRIKQHLIETSEGIHVSEVSSLLGDLDEDTSKALFGYCKGKGLRVDRAQYLYPADWPNSRRIWPNVAVHMALEKSPSEGISFEDISDTVRRLTKRIFNGVQISQILVCMEDSVFDPTTEKWKIESDFIADPEVEELEQGM